MNHADLFVAVLKGGPSAEHEVSLRTGAAVAQALRNLSYTVSEFEVDGTHLDLPPRVDMAFICLHGAFGEDGQVQTLLEQRGIPYTGSGIEASRLAMDKDLAKQRFVQNHVPTPQGQVWRKGDQVTVRTPFVIKPACEGSSVGLQFVEQTDHLPYALAQGLKFGDKLIIESMIKGRELTVSVLGDEALPVIEIRPKGGRYDYTTKYTAGATEYLCPAPLAPEITKKVQDVSLAAHAALGCSVYSRVDVMLDEENQPWVLEVNTIPGKTQTSLFPKAAKAAGLSFEQLCQKILELSWKKYGAHK